MTNNKVAVIFYYNKYNKNSINALAAALEDLLEYPYVYFSSDLLQITSIIKELLNNKHKIVLALSCLITQYAEVKLIISSIRSTFKDEKNLLIILGGPLVSGAPVLMQHIVADLFAIGEAEDSFYNLVYNLIYDKNIYDIPGIAFFNKNELHYKPRLFQLDINKYKPFSDKFKKFGPIEITRGCAYSCYFCQTSYLFKNCIRHRSIDNICKYAKILINNNLMDIRFISSNAFLYDSADGKSINITALEELLSNLKSELGGKRNLYLGSFPSEVRPEHVTEETMALIKKYAKNDNIIIGAQTGSEKLLKKCNRKHTVNDIYNAVILVNKFNIRANVDFIFGLPSEDDDDIKANFKVMHDLINLGAKIHAHIFIPLPATPFWKMESSVISKDLIKRLEYMTSKGHIYGQWRKQIKIREDIIKEMRTAK